MQGKSIKKLLKYNIFVFSKLNKLILNIMDDQYTRSLYNNKEISDITIKYKGDEYYLHKTELSKSEYFKMLFMEFKGDEYELILPNNVHPNALKYVILRMYKFADGTIRTNMNLLDFCSDVVMLCEFLLIDNMVGFNLHFYINNDYIVKKFDEIANYYPTYYFDIVNNRLSNSLGDSKIAEQNLFDIIDNVKPYVITPELISLINDIDNEQIKKLIELCNNMNINNKILFTYILIDNNRYHKDYIHKLLYEINTYVKDDNFHSITTKRIGSPFQSKMRKAVIVVNSNYLSKKLAKINRN
jgi:hypothetical protein